MLLLAVFVSALISISFASELLDIPTLNGTYGCGGSQPYVTLLSQAFVTTPDFDDFNFVKPNTHCSWIFKTNSFDQVVLLRNFVFYLGRNCSESFLDVYDGDSEKGTLLGRFCDYNFPKEISSSTNNLYLQFSSGPRPEFTGFSLYMEHILPTVNCAEGQLTCRHQRKCVSRDKICDGVDDCGDGTDEEYCGSDPEPPVPCGQPFIRPDLGTDKIVGGQAAVPGSWPWQVSLRLRDREPLGHECGAVVIGFRWLITAAHCFLKYKDPSFWFVSLGRYKKLIDEDTQQWRYIDRIIVHPEYRGFEPFNHSLTWLERKRNDIALVRLNAPVTFTHHVQHVCLPKPGDVPGEGITCYVTGWGSTYNTGSDLVLKQATVPTVSRSTCQKWYPMYQIGKTMLCAGLKEGGHDSCSGDSGGPLVSALESQQWILLGIVSTGGICGAKMEPGIYTAVPPYVEWINKTIEQTRKT